MFVFQGNAVIAENQKPVPPPWAAGHELEPTRTFQEAEYDTLCCSYHPDMGIIEK